MQAINRKQLFIASCLSLLVTSLSFGIRAGILGRLGVQFQLNAEELERRTDLEKETINDVLRILKEEFERE